MDFELISTRLGHDVMSEIREIIIFDAEHAQPGHYGLLELFCTTRKCDCRKVIFSVIYTESGSEDEVPSKVAEFHYGWESKAFYRKWMKADEDVDFMAGLYEQFPYPSLANQELFKIVEGLLKTDMAYRERIIRHYNAFKAVVERKRRGTSASRRKRKR